MTAKERIQKLLVVTIQLQETIDSFNGCRPSNNYIEGYKNGLKVALAILSEEESNGLSNSGEQTNGHYCHFCKQSFNNFPHYCNNFTTQSIQCRHWSDDLAYSGDITRKDISLHTGQLSSDKC